MVTTMSVGRPTDWRNVAEYGSRRLDWWQRAREGGSHVGSDERGGPRRRSCSEVAVAKESTQLFVEGPPGVATGRSTWRGGRLIESRSARVGTTTRVARRVKKVAIHRP